MKARWKILLMLLALGVIGGIFFFHAGSDARSEAEKTRRELRQQGFKTDLTEFDFGVSQEMQERADVMGVIMGPGHLASQMPNTRLGFLNNADLMIPAGERGAVVIWKQAKLMNLSRLTQFSYVNEAEGVDDAWPSIRDGVQWYRQQLDVGAAAVLSGPLKYPLRAGMGGRMLLPHLAGLRRLNDTFATRAILALHDGDMDAAWTNWLAATRLVTAWEIEPVEISQNVRNFCVETDYRLTWQALQKNGWTDERLAQLQREWESLGLFRALPDTVAFTGAVEVGACRDERKRLATASAPAVNPFKSPKQAFNEWWQRWQEKRYLSHGTYVDERDMLLFHRDRVKDMRRAVESKTWAEMRGLPGVTNQIFFQSRYTNYFSAARAISQTRRIATMMQSRGMGVTTLSTRVVEAEAERRLMITAIALERFHGRHGAYPKSVAELSPEFLKAEPVDFMDGKPLRYVRTEDGHYYLYSVGLSGVDDGGKMPTDGGANPAQAILRRSLRSGASTGPARDIFWPEPAADAAVAKMEEEKKQEAQHQKEEMERQQAEKEAQEEIARKAVVKLLLSDPKYKKATWSEGESGKHEPTFKASPLGSVLYSGAPQDAKTVSLDELLTLKAVNSDGETAVYELPIKYDVVTNEVSFHLTLLVDNPPDEPTMNEPILSAYERGTNGNCVVYWSTAYERPGQHALQAELMVMRGMDKQALIIKGPVKPYYSSNLCRFEEFYADFDDKKAFLHADLEEPGAEYTIEIKTRAGAQVKTFTGATTNGTIHVKWDLVDDNGRKFTKNFFESYLTVKLTQSGRSQTMKEEHAKAGTSGED